MNSKTLSRALRKAIAGKQAKKQALTPPACGWVVVGKEEDKTLPTNIFQIILSC